MLKAIISGLLVLLATLCSGCGMTITPPAGVSDTVEVYVADHGIHTSLVLPRDDGTLTEYSFSRFDWAALDQDQWYRSLPAILIPGPGTLGTREFPGPSTCENLLHQFELANTEPPVQKLYPVPVSAARCREVLAHLDQRWQSEKDTQVFNAKRGTHYVKDAAQYSIMHNCNMEVCGWLRELGCRVDGPAVTADVSVRPVAKPTTSVASKRPAPADTATP